MMLAMNRVIMKLMIENAAVISDTKKMIIIVERFTNDDETIMIIIAVAIVGVDADIGQGMCNLGEKITDVGGIFSLSADAASPQG